MFTCSMGGAGGHTEQTREEETHQTVATSGQSSGSVGYNVQVAIDTEHHLMRVEQIFQFECKSGGRPCF